MYLLDAEHNLALQHINNQLSHLKLKPVLDVGCGTGRVGKFLLDRDFDVTGIGPVQALLDAECVQHQLHRERMLLGSGEDLAFADDAFDASMKLGGLHQDPNPARAVAEMIRVNRHAFFISDCNRFGQGSFLSRLIKFGAWKTGLWKPIDLLRTRGKGYTISNEDGLAYSY